MFKILKFFDVDPGSRIRDGKNSDLESGIQDGKNFDPGSGIRDGKNSDLGSRIWDKHPGSAKLEILLPNLLGLKEPNNNGTLCGKAFWDETRSFLQSKVVSRAPDSAAETRAPACQFFLCFLDPPPPCAQGGGAG